MLNLLGLLDP